MRNDERAEDIIIFLYFAESQYFYLLHKKINAHFKRIAKEVNVIFKLKRSIYNFIKSQMRQM